MVTARIGLTPKFEKRRICINMSTLTLCTLNVTFKLFLDNSTKKIPTLLLELNQLLQSNSSQITHNVLLSQQITESL